MIVHLFDHTELLICCLQSLIVIDSYLNFWYQAFSSEVFIFVHFNSQIFRYALLVEWLNNEYICHMIQLFVDLSQVRTYLNVIYEISKMYVINVYSSETNRTKHRTQNIILTRSRKGSRYHFKTVLLPSISDVIRVNQTPQKIIIQIWYNTVTILSLVSSVDIV